MDEIDQAQAYQDNLNAEAVGRRAAVAGRPKRAFRRTCILCADPIPEERRAAKPGCVTCAFCAEEQEKMRGRK